MLLKIHATASGIALITMMMFWTASVWAEAFATFHSVVFIRHSIVQGMLVLIPSLIIMNASGFALRRKRPAALLSKKITRAKVITINGALVLLPSALVLNYLASNGTFGALFYSLQALELFAGVINITLLGMNIREGLALRRPSSSLQVRRV